MSKERILIVLSSLSFFLFLYLVFISTNLHSSEEKHQVKRIVATKKQSEQTKLANNPELKLKLKKTEQEYKSGVSVIYKKFSKLINIIDDRKLQNTDKDAMLIKEQIELIKKSMLELKVPDGFKGLHMNLFLAIVSAEDYFQNNKMDNILASKNMILKVGQNYNWIVEL